jgi:hypothetical protein
LLLPDLCPGHVWAASITLAVGIAVFVTLGLSLQDQIGPLGFASLTVLVLILVCDLPTGQHLLKRAWMSYSVMEGARYYGIGNEFAGAFIPASLLVSYALLTSKRRRFWPAVSAGLAVIAILVGLPSAGANAGCFLSAIMGFGVAGVIWWKGSVSGRDVILIVLLAGLLLAGEVAIDLVRGGHDQSHIGRALSFGGSITDIAWRKVALNVYLLFHSPWSLTLLAGIAGIWTLWRDPNLSLKSCITNDRIATGVCAGIVTSIVAILLFNDSGVVAAAEATVLTWAAASVICRRDNVSTRPIAA